MGFLSKSDAELCCRRRGSNWMTTDAKITTGNNSIQSNKKDDRRDSECRLPGKGEVRASTYELANLPAPHVKPYPGSYCSNRLKGEKN